MAVLRTCTICGRFSDQTRCPDHRPKDLRPSPSARGYDSRWQSISRRYLRSHPYCEELGCGKRSTEVDHIDGAGPRGDNSDENLQALCHSHHASKTAFHDGGFGRERTHG